MVALKTIASAVATSLFAFGHCSSRPQGAQDTIATVLAAPTFPSTQISINKQREIYTITYTVTETATVTSITSTETTTVCPWGIAGPRRRAVGSTGTDTPQASTRLLVTETARTTITTTTTSTTTTTTIATAYEADFVEHSPTTENCNCDYAISCGFGVANQTHYFFEPVANYQECINICDKRHDCDVALFTYFAPIGVSMCAGYAPSSDRGYVQEMISILIVKDYVNGCNALSDTCA